MEILVSAVIIILCKSTKDVQVLIYWVTGLVWFSISDNQISIFMTIEKSQEGTKETDLKVVFAKKIGLMAK